MKVLSNKNDVFCFLKKQAVFSKLTIITEIGNISKVTLGKGGRLAENIGRQIR